MTVPILVTGATGFLGSALLPRLEEADYEVHVLVRASSPREGLGEEVRVHEGDLLDPPSVDRAVAAVAARARELGSAARLVHAAALISYRATDGELSRRVNVEGTRVVLDAAWIHAVARVCLVSSVVAVGFARGNEVLDEEAEWRGSELRCPYTTTKRAAEDFARAVTDQLDVVVVNPGAIFGLASRPSRGLSNTGRFLQRLAARRLGPFAPPGTIAVVGVEDVADGILLALERGERGRRYLLTESSVTVEELEGSAAALLGVPPPRARVPRFLWRLLTIGAGIAERVRPAGELTSCALRHLGVTYRFDATRARTELGWTPRPFAEVLAKTIEGMREAEHLSPTTRHADDS